MSDVNPWDECGLTKAKYFSVLRSKLRELTFMSALSKPRALALNKAKITKKAPDKNGVMRNRTFFVCAECQDHFPLYTTDGGKKSLLYNVDHIEGAGQLNSMEDVGPFVLRLLAVSDNFQVLCKSCHGVKTYMERYGCTKEEAIASKQAIQWMKDNSPQEQKDFLYRLGYTGLSVSSAEKRKKLYFNYLLEK